MGRKFGCGFIVSRQGELSMMEIHAACNHIRVFWISEFEDLLQKSLVFNHEDCAKHHVVIMCHFCDLCVLGYLLHAVVHCREGLILPGYLCLFQLGPFASLVQEPPIDVACEFD